MTIKCFIVGAYQVNCYLLIDDDTNECAIIDPGYINKQIDSVILNNKYIVKYIFFTHGHFDHIGGLEYYMTKFNTADVYMHQSDIQSVLKEYDVFRIQFTDKEKIISLVNKYNDGDSFLLGKNKINVIHTPGHSKGSVCLYVNDILFSGDTLFEHSIGRTDFIDGDFIELEASIKNKLYNLPDNVVVYSGHGNSTKIIDEKNGNPFVRL